MNLTLVFGETSIRELLFAINGGSVARKNFDPNPYMLAQLHHLLL